jgi:hypothetical protein
MSAMTSLFWEDLTADLENPEFSRVYARECVQIALTDALVNGSFQS